MRRLGLSLMADQLAAALVAAAGQVSLQKGEVTDTAPLTVSLSGLDSVVTSKLASYSAPGTGDVVLVLVTGSAVVVLGELV